MRPRKVVIKDSPAWLPKPLRVRHRGKRYVVRLGEKERKAYGKKRANYSKYRNNWVGFIEEVLKETLTPDIKKVVRSVQNNITTLAKSCNGSGKSFIAARIAVCVYKVYDGVQVYTAAAPPEKNLEKILWGEINSIVEQHPHLFDEDDKKNLNIQRSALEFITGVTIPLSGTDKEREARFSGKHAKVFILFLLDESDAIPDPVFHGIESCMSGGCVRLLCLYNPRAKRGEVYRKERDRLAKVIQLTAFNHPNVITGMEVIPGAVSRDITVLRINEWTRPLAGEEKPDRECFEVPSFLEGTTAPRRDGGTYPPLQPGWRKITDSRFYYMVLAEYPPQDVKRLIADEWINRARSRWDVYVAENGEIPPKFTKAIMGQDVADEGNHKNTSCFRYGGWMERFVEWSGVDPIATGARAAEEYEKRNVARVNIDGTGVGAGVPKHMNLKGCTAVKVMVASAPTEETEMGRFKILRDQLLWALRVWLRDDPGAMIPPDEEFIEELQIITYEEIGGYLRVMTTEQMEDILKRHPEKIFAASYTFAPGGFFDGCVVD